MKEKQVIEGTMENQSSTINSSNGKCVTPTMPSHNSKEDDMEYPSKKSNNKMSSKGRDMPKHLKAKQMPKTTSRDGSRSRKEKTTTLPSSTMTSPKNDMAASTLTTSQESSNNFPVKDVFAEFEPQNVSPLEKSTLSVASSSMAASLAKRRRRHRRYNVAVRNGSTEQTSSRRSPPNENQTRPRKRGKKSSQRLLIVREKPKGRSAINASFQGEDEFAFLDDH
jgi:hypothetical protein